jgi:hypothetical protein
MKKEIPHGEFRRSRPPTFSGTNKVGQEAETWLQGMEWHFKIHNYLEREKAQIVIFSVNGHALIWWEHFLEVKGRKERKVTWEKFQKYFKEKYLSTCYYDNNRKEFHELKLGKKSMGEHVYRFMELLRYVEYNKEERVKIQSFLIGLPLSYRDRIEFSTP